MAFYDRHVREAIAAVRAAITATVRRSRDTDAARALLERLECLADERDYRARVLAEFGGPDTLLHGDLWLSNVAVLGHFAAHDGFGRPAPAIRLIDWDHVGPGSFSYDLSTLVLRFPADERPTIVRLYRGAAAGNGIDVPADECLDVLFTTAQYARIASETSWTALFVARDGSPWACEKLADINEWFECLGPRSRA